MPMAQTLISDLWLSLHRLVSGARYLRTKLTILYAGLFGLILIFVSLAVYSAISTAVQSQIRSELVASGTVFDRIWLLRTNQLRQGASLLARDFGFRDAVASGDKATIASATENLRERLGVELAFIVGVDGSVVSADPVRLGSADKPLLNALYAADMPSGVFVIQDVAYQVVAMPILSPDLAGWVVFAIRLDDSEMKDLAGLSAIPIVASVAYQDRGFWVLTGSKRSDVYANWSRVLNQALANDGKVPITVSAPDGVEITLIKQLPSLAANDHSALILTYEMALALAPYRPLLATLTLTSLLGLILVVVGSWGLARGVTRPISLLDQAVGRLQRGEEAYVQIRGHDEIGRLADNFNQMVIEIRAREARITHLASHDAETGLGNRLTLEDSISRRLNSGQVFVAAVGINRFDHVRGAIGYTLAAQAVREIGERLAAGVPHCVVGRLSTDILGLVFQEPTLAEAEVVVSRLLLQTEHPLVVNGDEIDVALTVGLSQGYQAGSVHSGIEQANIALDQARARRSKIATFDQVAYGDPASNLALMSGMLTALKSGDMSLFYQPKFDLRGRQINAVEGLVRWRHPVRGMLAPDLFIPMAEETSHIRALTDWVLDRAIEDQIAMSRAGHVLDISINVSGRLLGDHDFAELVERTLPHAVGKLCFEITETAVIENPELGLEILDRFRAAGVEISIDDFGSGLSSLAYLKQIKGHELKIDKSLIVEIVESQRDALIVRSTIDLAHSLGMKVTAEGVENAKVFQILAALGCDNVQGYFIAEPKSLANLLLMLDDPKQLVAMNS
jgi:EAL domain-containing protein (putative c-di-GMP-specific phosphodiesterase class I)/GGDEF domain-containing protein